MSVIIERRDLERLLRHLLHSEHREDIRLEIKHYVQFSLIGDNDHSAQTLVDPHQIFTRATARLLVKEAIETLDKEFLKKRKRIEAEQFLAQGVVNDAGVPNQSVVVTPGEPT